MLQKIHVYAGTLATRDAHSSRVGRDLYRTYRRSLCAEDEDSSLPVPIYIATAIYGLGQPAIETRAVHATGLLWVFNNYTAQTPKTE
jgi:hypothetical protein